MEGLHDRACNFPSTCARCSPACCRGYYNSKVQLLKRWLQPEPDNLVRHVLLSLQITYLPHLDWASAVGIFVR